MRAFRAFVMGSLFLAVLFEGREIERLRAEVERLKARAEAPDVKLQEALRLAEEGKSAQARQELERIAKQKAVDEKAAAEAQRRLAELERKEARLRAAEQARREREENKAALEDLLEPTGGLTPPKPLPKRLLQAPGCSALELEGNKFAGKRVALTDKVERIDKYYSFSKCAGIRISTDRLSREAETELASRFSGKDSATISLVGEYSGLDFYAEQIR